jgi:hypothetical protein
MEYTPEKIDQYVREASNAYNKGKQIFETLLSQIILLSINEVIENPEAAKVLQQKTLELEKILRKTADKYYDIVNGYEVGEYPVNVRQLDNLYSQLDSLAIDAAYLEYGVTPLMDAADDLSKFLQ